MVAAADVWVRSFHHPAHWHEPVRFADSRHRQRVALGTLAVPGPLPAVPSGRQLRGLTINGLLIAGLSLLPQVSGGGHLGGAVVGTVVAVLLHWHRFGSILV